MIFVLIFVNLIFQGICRDCRSLIDTAETHPSTPTTSKSTEHIHVVDKITLMSLVSSHVRILY